jgi:hypothetical protein
VDLTKEQFFKVIPSLEKQKPQNTSFRNTGDYFKCDERVL